MIQRAQSQSLVAPTFLARREEGSGGGRRRRLTASLLLATAMGFGACAPSVKKAKTPASDTETSEVVEGSEVGTLVAGEPMSSVAIEYDDARLGNEDAKVTLVAYLDFQCGFCSEGFSTLVKLRNSYSDEDLRIVFKHLPLESHEQSFPAAIVGQVVTQAAGSEAFFQFARNAFQNQSALSYQALAEWAAEAGVDRELYNEMVEDDDTAQRVIQDVVTARRLGVSSTPTFYINGRMLGGAQPVPVFHQMISEELKEMDKLKKLGWEKAYLTRVESNSSVSLVEALLEEDPDDYRLPVAHSPVRGNPLAPVTLVSFSDYECPFCKKAESTIQALREKHGHDLRVVFKQLPLGFHKNAMPAALLSSAVKKYKGDVAFYAASDDIFASSPELHREKLEEIGKKHGLTEEQIKGALDETDKELLTLVLADMELADDVLARGTPHFFINGKRLSGARPFEQFDALIEHEKKRAKEALASGIKPAELYAHLQKDALAPGAPQTIDAELTSEGNASRGAKDAPVDVHIFSDFECPYCKGAEENLAALEELFPGKLRFVWHDLPLPFHERARPAARAGREALAQKGPEAFWKLHELMFSPDSEQAAVGEAQLLAHAKALNLDLKKFEKAVSSEVHDAAIQKDEELAESLGINGTPAFVIGGYLVTGAKPVRFLKRVVALSLAAKESPAKK